MWLKLDKIFFIYKWKFISVWLKHTTIELSTLNNENQHLKSEISILTGNGNFYYNCRRFELQCIY